jgi:hypothetical protein
MMEPGNEDVMRRGRACAASRADSRRGQRQAPAVGSSIAQKKPDDSACKKALGSIPNQKAADPWAGMR